MNDIEKISAKPEMKCAATLVARWRDLAERRLEHMIELYQSGRWQRYYNETEFLRLVRELVAAVEAWKQLVPAETPDPSVRRASLDVWKDLGGGDVSLAPLWQGAAVPDASAGAASAPLVPELPAAPAISSRPSLPRLSPLA